jgi:hypothetical protein
MMATTHALAGVVLGTLVFLVAPDVGSVPVLAAALGGLFPDFDLYAGHRKTLHFPVYFSLAAIPASVFAFAVPSVASFSVALFLLAAATHSVMDAFGGGLELKPWEATSDRAVYDHFRGRWLTPRRWIRYDGAPEDLLLAVALAVPPLFVFDGAVEVGVGVALAVSATYALLRKPMVVAAERLVAVLPTAILDHVPDRFVEDFR